MSLPIHRVQLMRYYDEVLTQSARNYAFTKDKKWENRYRIIEPDSDTIIKESIETGNEEDRKILESLDKANQSLVAMEYRSLELVNQGKAEEAVRLLESDEYAMQKKILSGGLDNYVQSYDPHNDHITLTSFKKILDLEKKLAVHEVNLKNEKLSIIGELSARLAHDLRNPLSIIKNGIGLIKIQNPDINENENKNLQRMDRAVTRMTHLVDEVLGFVKSKSSVFQSYSLCEILDSSIEHLIKPEGIKINVLHENVMVLCDKYEMEIVFVNILMNAIQSMGNQGEITIRIHDEENYMLIEFEDTGSGIPADVLPKIFEPLFTTKQTGTGLGLISCKNIIEQHGGTIDVRTEVRKGTTFIIRLPKGKKDL